MTQPQGPDFTKGPGQQGGQQPQGYGPLPGYGGPPPGAGMPPSYGPPPGWGGQPPTGHGGPAPKKPRRWPWIAGGVVLLFIVIGALGGGSKDRPAPAARVSTSAPAPATPPPAATTTVEVVPPAVTTPVATTTLVPVTVPMPDVVCQNLQDAQDAIQAAGVFYSRSDDATGANRVQILDRDWVVVSQVPDPGVAIGEGDAVLSVVKITESNNC